MPWSRRRRSTGSTRPCGHRALEPGGREALLACIVGLIEDRHGGRVAKRYMNELAVAVARRVRIRAVAAADVPFLERMMLLAGFPPDRPLPPGGGHAARARFVEAWGRDGDVGCSRSTRRSARWARRWPGGSTGRSPRSRLLSKRLLVAAGPAPRSCSPSSALRAAAGHRELALTVSLRNPAARLYARAGYERVGDEGPRVVMRRRLG